MKKIFYDHGKWFAFEAPEKPNPKDYGVDNKNYFNRTNGKTRWYIRKSKEYEKAYAEAKANALEVGNPEELDKVNLVECPIVETKPEVILQWPGSAVIKDGKYILSI